jgi:SAM-dependent methyltransferase
MSDRDHWEREALHWIAWTRTPQHDEYWRYSPAFFETVPAPGRATLEIGCGEGRVARDLASRGHRVTGIDVAPTLVRAARSADPGGAYVIADAAHLPLTARRFDVAVAYNSLMDIDDLPGAIGEVERVLRPGGHLCLCITHPFADAGRFDSRDADAHFVVKGSYLEGGRFEELFERAGLQITFGGWRRPLAAYTSALEHAGFVIELLREPPHPREAGRWRRMPMFLFLRARSRPA